MFIAVTKHGICKLSFIDESYEKELTGLKDEWKNAKLIHSKTFTKLTIEAIFNIDKRKNNLLSILVSGTNFQIKVWKALLALRGSK